MNRRTFTFLGGVVAATFAARRTSMIAVARVPQRALTEFLPLDSGFVDEAHSRSFQMPGNASFRDQIESLYWITGLGYVLRSGADIDAVISSSFRSVPDWYVDGNALLTLGHPFAASLGGEVVGDGAEAWYWDVANPDDEHDIWRSFGIGCVAIWKENRLLMLWGCAARQNPVGALLKHAAAAFEGWDTDAMSLLPSIAQVPLGMVIIDEGPILENVVS